jgi:hypothetical protein
VEPRAQDLAIETGDRQAEEDADAVLQVLERLREGAPALEVELAMASGVLDAPNAPSSVGRARSGRLHPPRCHRP